MAKREARQYKALYFDLVVQILILESEDFSAELEPSAL